MNQKGDVRLVMSYLLQYWAALIVGRLIAIMPLSWVDGLAKAVGNISFVLLRERRQIALENLERAFGTKLSIRAKKRIAKEAFQNTAISLVELFVAERIVKNPRQHFEIPDVASFERLFDRKKGVVMACSHLGSWEYLSFLHFLTDKKMACPVKEIRNPYLDREVNRLRRVMKLNPILKKTSAREILKRLRANEAAAILIDQWAGNEGVWMDFFDHGTSTTFLPARLSQMTGCALVACFCVRTGVFKYRIEISPPLYCADKSEESKLAVTRQLNRILEERIRKYPGQWSWAHRRWKNKKVDQAYN